MELAGLRALGCRLPVSLSQGLPVPGPQSPSPYPGWDHSESLSRSSFLWVDKGGEGAGGDSVLIQGVLATHPGDPRDLII